jgi:hypothetical protein
MSATLRPEQDREIQPPPHTAGLVVVEGGRASTALTCVERCRPYGIDFESPPLSELDDLLASRGNRADDPLLAHALEARRLAGRGLARSTQEGYARGVLSFIAFATELRLEPIPPQAGAVMAWLESLSAGPSRVRVVTMEKYLGGLNKACQLYGWLRPGDNAQVRHVVAGLRRRYLEAPQGAEALTLEDLQVTVAAIDSEPAAAQRVALTLLAAAGVSPVDLRLMRREAVSIDQARLTCEQPAHGRWSVARDSLSVLRAGTDLCPVAAVERLLAVSPATGPLFTTSVGDPRMVSRGWVGWQLPELASAAGLSCAARDWTSLSTADLAAIVAAAKKPSLRDVRDRTMLIVAFGGALRRGNLVGVCWRYLTVREGYVQLFLVSSKTDQEGEGQMVILPFTKTMTDPAQAVVSWLERVTEELGGDPRLLTPDAKIFSALGRTGRLLRASSGATIPLNGEAFSQVVKKRTARAGLRLKFTGHSPRSGCITSGIEKGLSMPVLMATARVVSPEMISRYDRTHRRERTALIQIGL